MKIVLFSLLLIFGTGFVKAQSYAFIDSDYIMKNVPEYLEAKEKLDKLSEKWTKEIIQKKIEHSLSILLWNGTVVSS